MAIKKLVNLDALIPRQDLETRAPGAIGQSGGGGVPVSELEAGKLHYRLLRKPDFQRETDDWDIDNVVTLIKSHRDSHLIPAIIMWRAEQGYTFVIDGAHRLSAFIAWVNDDYGDREISRKFFNHKIPKQQEDIAAECRARIASEVGTYSDLSKLDANNPSPERVKWASNISKSIVTQWVEGDASHAEKSFIAINQRSIPINETEKYMILARHKPNVISARALIRCGTGHEYWSKFPANIKEEITTNAKKIYDVLFEPENAEILKTIEMPIAGKHYSADALRLTLEIVNFSNDWKTKAAIEAIEDEEEIQATAGTKTVGCLDRTFGVVKYLSGSNPASLGLHPAVYFWGATGKHQPAAFLATISFLQYLIANNKLVDFCKHRAYFEEFLINRASVVKHILGAYGGWKKSAPTVFEMYKDILDAFMQGKNEEEIEAMLTSNPKFGGLAELIELERNPGARPTREVKAAVRRRELLKSSMRCKICWARLPSTSISDDHTQKKQVGGKGSEENMEVSHHFCNHGFKEHLLSHDEPLPQKPSFA